MVLGAGLGDVGDASFTHFGEETDARRRASKLDEALELIGRLWTGEPFVYEGAHFNIGPVVLTPTPCKSRGSRSGSAAAIRAKGRAGGRHAGTVRCSSGLTAAICCLTM